MKEDSLFLKGLLDRLNKSDINCAVLHNEKSLPRNLIGLFTKPLILYLFCYTNLRLGHDI